MMGALFCFDSLFFLLSTMGLHNKLFIVGVREDGGEKAKRSFFGRNLVHAQRIFSPAWAGQWRPPAAGKGKQSIHLNPPKETFQRVLDSFLLGFFILF